MEKETINRYKRYKRGESFRVGLIVEAYKEFNVVALDEEEAVEIVKQRVRKSVVLRDHKYNVGDIEVISVERKKK